MNRAGLTQKLNFRLTAPLFGLVLVIGAVFGFVVLELVENFQWARVREDMVWTSRVVYKIVDDHYFQLVQTGEMDNPVLTRIQQGRAIENLESFMRQKDFQAAVYDDHRKQFLLSGDLPPEFIRQLNTQPGTQVYRIPWKDTRYFSYHIQFQPWNWRIILVKGEAHYLTLQSRVRSVYLGTGLLLLLAGAAIYYFQNINIKRPVTQIIGALRENRPPNYRGIHEFSYLSDSIREMMVSLEDREQFLSNVLDSIQDGIGILDDAFIITRINPTLEKLLPESAPLLGKRGNEVLCELFGGPFPDCADIFSRPTFRLLKRLRSDGEVGGYLEFYTFPVVHKGEGPARNVIFYLRDITEQKLAEEALRSSEGRFRTIFHTSPDPIVIFNPETSIIIDINQAFLAVTGFDREQVIGRTSLDLSLWANLDQRAGLLEQLATRGEVVNMEAQFQLRDGSVRTGLISARVISLDLETRVVLVVRDITREKEAEKALLEMDRLKNEFISTAAHELRTPLAAVMGYSEALLHPEEFGDLSSEEKTEYLQVIHEKSDLLAKTIDDLLDISRIAAGGAIHLEVSEHSLAPIMDEMVREFRMQYPRHRFETDLNDLRGRLCRIDRDRLTQVLQNLLSNAAKYSVAGSTVTIHCEDHDDHLRFEVADKGIGMTPEQVERMFDKFYRADHSLSGISGLGLGMNIVKTVVEAHGGTIWTESNLGEGTRVFFTLPKEPPADTVSG